MTDAALLSGAGSGTIPDPMFREAVRKRMGKLGMNTYQLAAASEVRYSRLHDWLNNNSDSIRSDSLEKISKALGLVYGEPPAPKRARKAKP